MPHNQKAVVWVLGIPFCIPCMSEGVMVGVGPWGTAELYLVKISSLCDYAWVLLNALVKALWYFVEGYVAPLWRDLSVHIILPFRKLHFCKTVRSCFMFQITQLVGLLPELGLNSENYHYLFYLSDWYVSAFGGGIGAFLYLLFVRLQEFWFFSLVAALWVLGHWAVFLPMFVC